MVMIPSTTYPYPNLIGDPRWGFMMLGEGAASSMMLNYE